MCMGGAPEMPAVPPPEPPKQPEKAPDQDVFKSRNKQTQQMAASAGNQSTLLSGAGGIETPLQNLGKSLYLGS